MDNLLFFGGGVVVGLAACYFIARNNKKKFTDALNLDPKAKWTEIRAKIAEKF